MASVAEALTVSLPCPAAYVPAADSEAVAIYLSCMRKAGLKQKYGWGTGLPKLPRESCPPEQLARAKALLAVGLEKRADRAEICGRVGELFECPACLRAFKAAWNCSLRSCPDCAKKIFSRAFAELVPLDKEISGALRSLPGWGWKILDFTFRHDGDFPSREAMREMRRVINRVTDRAVREERREMYLAGRGCRIRFDESGSPMSCDGWPYVSAPDGSARVLMGWTVVRPGRVGKRATCHCGARVKKIKGENARLCPNCGPREWPDWENQEVDTRRWRLRFGFLQVSVSEFGYSKETGSPNNNYHFHGCYFGPILENRPTCVECGEFVRRVQEAVDRWNCPKCGVTSEVHPGRMTQIFMEESKKAFGVASRGLLIERASKGYRSALAHALKYAGLKMPASTPEGLALYEKVLVGVRRYAVRGFLQGVALEEEKRGAPKCPECKKELKRVSGLGVVPLSEIQDIPLLPDDEPDYAGEFKDDEFCFLEPEEMLANGPRAPC